MVAQRQAVSERSRDRVYKAIAHERRRTALSLLQRLGETEPEELAIHLIAEETDKPLLEVTDAEAERVHLALEHIHLPQLSEQNLVTRHDGAVKLTRHPALRDPVFEELIRTDAPTWDAVLDGLAHGRRRLALHVLYTNGGRMDREALATEIAETFRRVRNEEVTIEPLLLTLHHIHLPKLAEAALVRYDDDAETVVYEGHPDLDDAWLSTPAELRFEQFPR